MTREEASKIIKDGLEDMSLDFADEEQYEALTMAIKALQEPTDRIEYGTDGNAYKLWISNGKEYEPKTGHWFAWKPKDDVWRTTCSECGEETRTLWNYCPNCGARMVEPQESEE